MLAKERRKKKRVNEKKAQMREKLRLKMIDPDDRIDMEGDTSLFSLKKIQRTVRMRSCCLMSLVLIIILCRTLMT